MGTIRVVVADDDAAIRDVLQLALTTAGMELAGIGADGHDAIRLVGTHRPDVIVLDLEMPRMDGREAIPFIRKACESTRIVLFTSTALATDDFIDADEIVSKAAPLDSLLAAIQLAHD